MPPKLTRRGLLFAAAAITASRAQAALRPYVLVQDRSTITFSFTSDGTTQSGTVPVSTADIRVDLDNLARSRATVTADIRKVRTGLVLITQTIKSDSLLDAANHPTVRFVSTGITLGARGRISEGAQIRGDLTLRGQTRPIILDATLSRPAGTAPDDLSVLYIRLTGQFSRSAFGATGYPGLADDAIGLDIRAEIRARS